MSGLPYDDNVQLLESRQIFGDLNTRNGDKVCDVIIEKFGLERTSHIKER